MASPGLQSGESQEKTHVDFLRRLKLAARHLQEKTLILS